MYRPVRHVRQTKEVTNNLQACYSPCLSLIAGWEVVTMDFIMALPPTRSQAGQTYDAILVFVDKLSK